MVIKFISSDPVNRVIGNIANKKLRIIKFLLLDKNTFIIELYFYKCYLLIQDIIKKVLIFY